MHSDNTLDIQINSGLWCKHYFLLCFQIGKDNSASLRDCKNQPSYLLIGDVARYVLGKKITDAEVWHAQGRVLVQKTTRL